MKIKTKAPTETLTQFADRMSVRFSIAAGVLTFVVIATANIGRNPVPMVGDGAAFGTMLVTLIEPIILVSTFIAFILGVKKWNSLVKKERQKGWKIAVFPLALTTGVLSGTIVQFGIKLFEQAFVGLELALLQGVAISTAVAVLWTYYIIKQVLTIDTQKMLTILILSLAVGVYMTMVRISDTSWWHISFSYLGTADSSANYIFNFTLMLGGILIVCWTPMFLNDFRILLRGKAITKKSYKLSQYLFIILGIAIFNVGMFPSRASAFSSFMHNISAYSLAVVFAIFMFASKWLVPKFSKEYFTATYTLLGTLIAALLMAAVGYFNTVGLEISGFVIGLAWLTQFVSNSEYLARKLEPESFPK